MPQFIDVTGVPPQVIEAMEALVAALRDKTAASQEPSPSVFDLFGKAPQLRTGDDIARQVREERDAWGES